MYELNTQQIDSVNGGGILTGALIGLAVMGMKIGFGLTAGAGRPAGYVPCAPAPAPVRPPSSGPRC